MALKEVGKLVASTLNNSENEKKLREKGIKVIDEDTHIANIEKIIVRDFFPDLPKVQTQLDYLEALERNDTKKLSELKQKFLIENLTNTPSVTPSTFETPSSSLLTPASLKSFDSKKKQNQTRNSEPQEAKDEELKKMSLNEYMGKHKSEDDVSFEEVMEEAEKKLRLKHSWMYQPPQQLAIQGKEEQKKLEMWDYVPKNAVMYVPEGKELSISEKMEMSKEKKQQIAHNNTRFVSNPYKSQQQSNPNNLNNNRNLLDGKVGPDGKEILPTRTPSVGGYKFMATPSPAPGVDASPLMTWGEIEGTPFALERGETPRMGGPSFKIPEVPRKDRILHQLAEKASKAHRTKKEEALKQAAFNIASSPRSLLSKTERIQTLSPAAQRLASKKCRLESDLSLKASYTPKRNTNEISTPKSFNTPNRSPYLTPSKRKAPDTSPLITDNLLQLPTKSKDVRIQAFN